MAPGGGRWFGGVAMLIALFAVFAGAALAIAAVDAAERQIADLDESNDRAQSTIVTGSAGIAAIAGGVVLALLALLVYAISSVRARNRAVPRAPAPRVFTIVGAVGIALALLFLLLSPAGPLVKAASIANGGGGPAGAVQLETFEGNVTAATIAGQTNDEDVHVFSPVTPTGSIRMRFVSGGEGVQPIPLAVLEAPTANGWIEVARARGPGDVRIDVPAATYEGDLRIRVRIDEGGIGGIEYLVAISFLPTAPP